MAKTYRFWLWAAVVLLLLTAIIHAATLFVAPQPQNETEKQLLRLLVEYRQDFGAGFQRSMKEIFIALSACFSLICLLGGLTLGYLAKAKPELRILKGVVGIHVLVFAICFGVMAVFTFLPPIVLTGLIFVTLLITYFLLHRQRPETVVN